MSRYFLGDAAYAAEQLRPLVVTHPEEARFREHYAQALAKSQDMAFHKYRENEGIQSWIRETHDAEISNHKSVGAIVMNCNPFTLGSPLSCGKSA